MLSNIISGVIAASAIISKLTILVFENMDGDTIIVATDIFDKCISVASEIIGD